MADKQIINERFSPEWDSEDTSNIDDDELADQGAARDTETGAVIGVIGGAVVGAIAGGPIGAVVGGVLGGVAGGAGVAAVERYDHDEGVHHRDLRDENDERANNETFVPYQAVDGPGYAPTLNADAVNPMSSPYPGDAGRPEVVQYNGVGIYDAPASPANTAVYDTPAETSVDEDRALETGETSTYIENQAPVSETVAASRPVDDVDAARGRVTFTLSGYVDAEQVSVAGTFNDWSTTQDKLYFDNGLWVAEIALAPGKYQYKFVVDGTWMPDPNNPESVEDGVGSTNSVVTVDRDIVNPGSILGYDTAGTSAPTGSGF